MRTKHDTCHMYAHDRIEVFGTVNFSLIGKFATEYASGPNLLELADYAAKIAGNGSYGLKSCRNAGFYGTSGLGGDMTATITTNRSTLTYTVRIYNDEGKEVHSDWCSSYRLAEHVARQYYAHITNLEG